MTEQEFVSECEKRCTGVIKMAAGYAVLSGQHHVFIREMIEQDSDEGSRAGTKRVLGEELYAELQKFKTK